METETVIRKMTEHVAATGIAFDALVEEIIKVLDDQPEETSAWQLMNDFASGKTQGQWSRVEPLAVLGEVYYRFAIARQTRQAKLKALQKVMKRWSKK